MPTPSSPTNHQEMLVHMAIHDLRAPLASIMTGIELSLQPDMSLDDIKRVLRLCLDSSGTLMRQIESFLEIPRLVAGEMPLHLAPTPIGTVLVGALSLLKNSFDEMRVQLEQHFEVPGPVVHADEELMRRVFVNLIDNALHHTPSGERIRIEVEGDESVIVRVSDDGPGVPPEARAEIFEGARRENPPRRPRRGHGWGLAFCKLAVEAHGGTIEIDAAASLKGACFVVQIPVLPALPS